MKTTKKVLLSEDIITKIISLKSQIADLLKDKSRISESRMKLFKMLINTFTEAELSNIMIAFRLTSKSQQIGDIMYYDIYVNNKLFQSIRKHLKENKVDIYDETKNKAELLCSYTDIKIVNAVERLLIYRKYDFLLDIFNSFEVHTIYNINLLD